MKMEAKHGGGPGAPEAEGSRKELPGASGGGMALPTLSFLPHLLQNLERMHFCCVFYVLCWWYFLNTITSRKALGRRHPPSHLTEVTSGEGHTPRAGLPPLDLPPGATCPTTTGLGPFGGSTSCVPPAPTPNILAGPDTVTSVDRTPH